MNRRSFFILLRAALIMTAVALLASYGYRKQTDVPSSISSLTLETKPIETLLPHVHAEGEPDAPHSIWLESLPWTAPRDLWITGIRAEVNHAPVDILHHALLFRLDTKSALCPNLFPNATEIFAASVNTATQPLVFKQPYGIFLKKDTPIILIAMFHNPEPPFGPGATYHNVSVRAILDTAPVDGSRSKPLEFYRLRLDDTPCAPPPQHEAFQIPPGAKHFIRKENNHNAEDPSQFTFDRAGVITVFGANMWPTKGAEKINAYLNNAPLVELIPHQYDAPWRWSIPIQANVIIPVKKGDTIAVEATYSNPFTDKPIRDASGMFGFYYAPDK